MTWDLFRSTNNLKVTVIIPVGLWVLVVLGFMRMGNNGPAQTRFESLWMRIVCDSMRNRSRVSDSQASHRALSKVSHV